MLFCKNHQTWQLEKLNEILCICHELINISAYIHFYTTYIRPALEYACPVFHHSLPQYLSNEMEMLQKRALRIMQPDLSYAEALVALDITSLYERRKALRNALFD